MLFRAPVRALSDGFVSSRTAAHSGTQPCRPAAPVARPTGRGCAARREHAAV